MAERITSAAQARAWADLSGHRWWAYRACAASPDAPGMSAADPTVPVSVWLTPDQESQLDRMVREQTAAALCGGCPIRAQCLAYAQGGEDGPYERRDMWGGLTARERRAARARTRPVPKEVPVTALDLAVLRALAVHRSPRAVAAAAGLTVTRANWHRANLVTKLCLDPQTTTRMRLLQRARAAGLLDPRTPLLVDRGRIIAAVPSRQAAVARSQGPRPGGTQLALPEPPPTTPLPAGDATVHQLPARTAADLAVAA